MAMAPGQGPPPYTNENRAGVLIGTTSAFGALALIFVVLRIYTRAIVIRKWGADDTLAAISGFLAVLTGVLFSIGTRYGLSYHIWAIPVDSQHAGSRMLVAATLCYHVTFITVKMTFLLQFRRVFSVANFRLVCDVMFGFICSFGVAVIVSTIIISAPTWNGDTLGAARYDQCAWWLGAATVHLITDIIIFLMPIPMLHKLNLKRTPKIALMISFGLGFITSAISIVKLTTLSHTFTLDVTWDVIPALVCSDVEVCCAVICACIPTLRPLLRVISGQGETRQTLDRSSSYTGENSRLACRTLKATPTISSERNIPSPCLLLLEEEIEPKATTIDHHSDGGLVLRTAISPTLTARAGESDDGSVRSEFGPVDEEVATPLSPPPKVYNSPTKAAFPRLPDTAEDDEEQAR